MLSALLPLDKFSFDANLTFFCFGLFFVSKIALFVLKDLVFFSDFVMYRNWFEAQPRLSVNIYLLEQVWFFFGF